MFNFAFNAGDNCLLRAGQNDGYMKLQGELRKDIKKRN